MKIVFIALFTLLSTAFLSIADPQDDQFQEIKAKATQMGKTAEGKAYEKRFSWMFASPMDDALRECTRDIKPPYTVDVVFIINADGTIQRILPAPGELISAGIAIKLKNLKVPRPPKAGWMVAVEMEVNELKTPRDIEEDLPPQNKSMGPGIH